MEVHCGFDLKNIRAEKHMFVVGEFIRRFKSEDIP